DAELELVKLYAKQIRDRALLEEATIFQMRCERHLGVLLIAAKNAGQIAEGRRRKDETHRVTLSEIGVDAKLSMKAQQAAALDDGAFERVIETSREKIRSGRAILVDPIQAATKEGEIARRRAAHAARTLTGGKVEDLRALIASGWRARLVGMDPQ